MNFQNKHQNHKDSSTMKNISIKKGFAILLGMMPIALFAQEVATQEPILSRHWGDYLLLTIVAIVLIAAIVAIYNLLNLMTRSREIKIYEEHGLTKFLDEKRRNEGSWWNRFSRSMSNIVPIEEEKDIMFDHEYDGIRELDNNLPPWWLYGFYLTIVIAFIYMGVWHFSPYAKSSSELYDIEMEQAAMAVEAFVSRQADQIDETNVELLVDEGSLSEGKELFTVNCVACHLDHGGGNAVSVGPNLTDEYWIHGGGIKNVFKTIKYGVPEKGMISWATQMRPADMHKVASYVLSLQGTNPPEAKEPQGEKWVAEAESEASVDSTTVEMN
jgi:cytochrome c oxidase cbb3-type subunit 3